MSASQPIQLPCTLDRANRRKDRSVSITVTTNLELSPEEYTEIDRRVGDSGWWVWRSNEANASDIPDVPADEATSNMTPSQEMRWLLRKQWERNGRDMAWPEYYGWRMSKACQGLRDQLQQ